MHSNDWGFTCASKLQTPDREVQAERPGPTQLTDAQVQTFVMQRAEQNRRFDEI